MGSGSPVSGKNRFFIEFGVGPQLVDFEPVRGALKAPRTWGYDLRMALEWAPFFPWIRLGVGQGLTNTSEMLFADSEHHWTEFYFHIHSPFRMIGLKNIFIHLGYRWTQIYSIDALHDDAGWRSSWLPFGGVGFSTQVIYGRFSVLYVLTGGHFLSPFRRYRFEKGSVLLMYEISI